MIYHRIINVAEFVSKRRYCFFKWHVNLSHHFASIWAYTKHLRNGSGAALCAV